MLRITFPCLCNISIYLNRSGFFLDQQLRDNKTLLVIKFLQKVDNTQPSLKKMKPKDCPKSMILYES
jgi:hypothetical protein